MINHYLFDPNLENIKKCEECDEPYVQGHNSILYKNIVINALKTTKYLNVDDQVVQTDLHKILYIVQ